MQTLFLGKTEHDICSGNLITVVSNDAKKYLTLLTNEVLGSFTGTRRANETNKFLILLFFHRMLTFTWGSTSKLDSLRGTIILKSKIY